MNEIISTLKEIVKRDPGSKLDYLAYLTEEVGEVATAIAVDNGTKNKKLKESVEQECCDVIVTAIATILKFNSDWTWKEIKDYIEQKANRWSSRV